MTLRVRARPTWPELPAAVRGAVERALGSRVTSSESRAGGWSPGSADLVTTAGGRRAFVKTADARVNLETVAMHRREVEVLRLLAGGPAPRLLGVVDARPWFGLVVEAVDGRHPDPLAPSDTRLLLDAVGGLPVAPAGGPLRRIEDELADAAHGWRRLREDGVPLPDEVREHLPHLEALAARMPHALRGDSVVHGDLRVDNALVDPVGGGRLIDWPSAVVGARWLDAVTYLLDVRHLGGSIDGAMRHPVLRDVPAEDVDAWLSVLGAYFLDSARRPEPPGLAGIRDYQAAQGATVLSWLLERRRGY
ncbi:phosphotransferase [uncultured Amnibacterium sp.]|uniref:phosphotransferase n=1 Tax=uncultured Amnibacterium sp. TaxID=1631851 RepID=UPI0035C9ED8E